MTKALIAMLLVGSLASCADEPCSTGDAYCDGNTALNCVQEDGKEPLWQDENCPHACVETLKQGRVEERIAFCAMSRQQDSDCLANPGVLVCGDVPYQCGTGDQMGYQVPPSFSVIVCAADDD